jgi:hypothetical protein
MANFLPANLNFAGPAPAGPPVQGCNARNGRDGASGMLRPAGGDRRKQPITNRGGGNIQTKRFDESGGGGVSSGRRRPNARRPGCSPEPGNVDKSGPA